MSCCVGLSDLCNSNSTDTRAFDPGFTHISGPASPLSAAFARDFVLMLSRMTVVVLVLDCIYRIDYEHEHHFIEHEHDGSQKDVGKDGAFDPGKGCDSTSGLEPEKGLVQASYFASVSVLF